MAITSIDLHGQPWIVCDPQDQKEIDSFIAASGVDPGAITQRAPTTREAAKVAAERVFRSMRGEQPDGLFGVSL